VASLLQSGGTTVYPTQLDLEAGRYALLCFVGDPKSRRRPARDGGMIAMLDVS